MSRRMLVSELLRVLLVIEPTASLYWVRSAHASMIKPRTRRGLIMEGLVGIEPTTRSLKGSCSTTELQARVNGLEYTARTDAGQG